MVRGLFESAWEMKLGIMRPSSSLILGPYELKILTMRVSRLWWRWYAPGYRPDVREIGGSVFPLRRVYGYKTTSLSPTRRGSPSGPAKESLSAYMPRETSSSRPGS